MKIKWPNLKRLLGQSVTSSESYTVEQLAQLAQDWRWQGNYVEEQTQTDITNARRIEQNNGYGKEAVNLVTNSIIGKTGIVVSWQNDMVQERWDNYRWNPAKPDERFIETQRTVMRNMALDGESFVRFLRRREGLFIEHIDPLLIPHEAETLGIMRNELGQPTSYKVRFDDHRSAMIPARDMCHTYLSRFSSTRRGLSMLRAAIEPLTALKTVTHEYQQAVRMQLSFRAMVKYNSNDPDVPKNAMGNVDIPRLSRMLSVQPERMTLVPGGLDFVQPQQATIDARLFTELKKALLSEAARAVGVSYFSLASDLEGANFSSLRQGAIEDKDLYYYLLSTLQSFVSRCVREWMAWESLSPSADAELMASQQPQFHMPNFEFIDPAKEAAALKTMYEMHAISLSEIIRKDNREPDQTFRLIAEDMKKLQDEMEAQGVEMPGVPGEEQEPEENDPDDEDEEESDDETEE